MKTVNAVSYYSAVAVTVVFLILEFFCRGLHTGGQIALSQLATLAASGAYFPAALMYFTVSYLFRCPAMCSPFPILLFFLLVSVSILIPVHAFILTFSAVLTICICALLSGRTLRRKRICRTEWIRNGLNRTVTLRRLRTPVLKKGSWKPETTWLQVIPHPVRLYLDEEGELQIGIPLFIPVIDFLLLVLLLGTGCFPAAFFFSVYVFQSMFGHLPDLAVASLENSEAGCEDH